MIRPGVRRWFRLPVRDREIATEDVQEEIRLHIELRAEQLIAAGVPREQAYARARTLFGSIAEVERQLYQSTRRVDRAMLMREWLDTVKQDATYALRTLRAQRGFAIAAVLTLALGMGASTAIYSLVDATMLSALPFRDADRLRMLRGVAGPERNDRGASFAEIADWRSMTRSFDDIAVYDARNVNLSGDGDAVQLPAEFVSSSYFELVGGGVSQGRTFNADDDVTGGPPVAIISDALWRGRFGSDPQVVGRTVTLDGTRATIVGVAAPGFRGLSFNTDIWATWGPLLTPAAQQERGSRWLSALALKRAGVTDEAAFADLDAAAVRLEQLHPGSNTDRRVNVYNLRDFYLSSTRTLMIVLFAAVGILLLIACANVMNLQLVRGLARSREVALRTALGAGRGRIIRQLITESVVIALLGGVLGVALAYWGLAALLPLIPPGVLPPYADVSINGSVLLFTFLVVVMCALLAGLLPAVRVARDRMSAALRETQRTGTGTGRARLQRLIVAGEMALAVALIIGAGLMVRSLRAQLAIDAGVSTESTFVGRVSLTDPVAYETPEAVLQFADKLVASLRAQPGITDVALASDAPLRGYNAASILVRPEREDDRVRYYRHRVTPEYFTMLDIPIVRGRTFDPRDRSGSQPVVIVSESFAARIFPGEDAVGRELRLGATTVVQIVGIARDVHMRDLTTDLRAPDDDPDVYFPYAQMPAQSIDIIVRGAGRMPTAADLHAAVAPLDPTVAVFDAEPLQANMDAQTATARFGSFVLTTFALLALTLASVGLYGVITFLVNSRRRDIAVRIALGANRSSILQLIMRQGMIVAAAGVVVGGVAALLSARFLSAFLYQVQPTDPRTIASSVFILLAIATLANLIPALRAARTQPEAVLRAE